MTNENYPELKRNPVFEKLIQPMTEKETGKMADRLIMEPPLRIINVWNGYHLNDYAKYQICLTNDLPCEIAELTFPDENSAASYICSIQLERHDLTEEYRKYLIGKKLYYDLSQISDSNTEKANAKYRVAYRIGESVHLVSGTVLKYNVYSSALDMLFEISPELAENILMGKIKMSHENVIEVARLSPEDIQRLSRAALTDGTNHLTYNDIRHGITNGFIPPRIPPSKRERAENKDREPAGIRQMPVYDPDSEVNSLCMTITSWVSSVERVNRSVNYSAVTGRAKLELMKHLTILEQTIRIMQKSLIERPENDK